MKLNWLQSKQSPWKILEYSIRIYPSPRCCVRTRMDNLRPEQLPPLMVRKAPWRRT